MFTDSNTIIYVRLIYIYILFSPFINFRRELFRIDRWTGDNRQRVGAESFLEIFDMIYVDNFQKPPDDRKPNSYVHFFCVVFFN